MSFNIIIENNLNINDRRYTLPNSIQKTYRRKDIEEYDKSKEIINKENNKYNYPENISKNFLCPITHDIFYQSVITCDGQTYEKMDSIVLWKGNETSPLTGPELESLDIVPNIILKNIINDWKKQYLK